MESKKFKFNKDDLLSIGKGFLIMLGGATVTYLAELVPQIDLGVYTPLFVVFAGLVINTVRKYLAGK